MRGKFRMIMNFLAWNKIASSELYNGVRMKIEPLFYLHMIPINNFIIQFQYNASVFYSFLSNETMD